MAINTFNYEIPKDQQSQENSAQYIEPSMTVDEAVAGRNWRAEKQDSVAAQNAQMIEGLGVSQQPMNQQNITNHNQGTEVIENVEGPPASPVQEHSQPLGSSDITQLINSLTAGDQSGPTTLSVTSGLNGFNYKIDGQLSDNMYL